MSTSTIETVKAETRYPGWERIDPSLPVERLPPGVHLAEVAEMLLDGWPGRQIPHPGATRDLRVVAVEMGGAAVYEAREYGYRGQPYFLITHERLFGDGDRVAVYTDPRGEWVGRWQHLVANWPFPQPVAAEQGEARSIPVPVGWDNSAAGPVPRFDYLHLRLHPDGTVTWFADKPGAES